MPLGTSSDRPDRPVALVLVSDDAIVETALREALPEIPGDVSLTVLSDADAAFEALPEVDPGERFRTVPVALVDVDAAPEASRALVARLKDDPAHRRIPVLALAQDPDGVDASTLYDAHANAVLQRPEDPDELAERFVQLLTFWLTVPALP